MKERPEHLYTLEGLRVDPARQDLTFTRFFDVCGRYGGRDALVFLGTRFTYAELGDAVDRFATALHHLGVAAQDRVMLYLPNTPQWVIANFAIQKLGAVAVPVSPIFTAWELEYMVEDAGVETIVCLDANFGYVHEIFERSPLRRVIVTTVTELLPVWKRTLGRLLDVVPGGTVARDESVHTFRRLLRFPADPPAVRIDPWRDLASILYTGGTTSRPKAVPGNHMTEVAYVRDVMDGVFRDHVDPEGGRLLLVMPLYHIMARGFFLAAGLHCGNTTILMPEFQADALMKEVERHRVRWLLGVPALYRRLLENERLGEYRLDSLRYCYCGGDVLPGEVFERWRELTGAPIYQVYGATEVGHVAYSRLDAEPDPKTIGRPLKSYRCRVVDPETLATVPAGETGELLVTADFNLKSYWNRPEETGRSFVELDGEIYYRTGDQVTLEDDGRIRFMERTADIIKHKGFRVSASEVEAVLQDHPTVVGACVVGVDDETVGERIKAIVVLRHDTRGISGNDLRAWCRERLAGYKVPHYVEFRDMLPRSKVGKLLRREIRAEESRRARAE